MNIFLYKNNLGGGGWVEKNFQFLNFYERLLKILE
jgi:hypothetical protein